jgi:uncharacterized protein YjbJ (UPF0337 family)
MAGCASSPRPKQHPATQHQEDIDMSIDKNRIAGAAKQAKGATKEAIGDLVGDKSMELSGKAKKIEGKVQSAVGKAKDNMKTVMKKR